MSILIVCDIDFNSEYSILRLEYLKDALKRLFLDDEFNKEYSECLISLYFVLDKMKRELVFSNPRFKELSWHPVGNCSLVQSLTIIDTIMEQIKNSIELKAEQDSPPIKSEVDVIQQELRSIPDCFNEFLKEGATIERSELQREIDNFCIPGPNSINWTEEHQNIGKERQLLVIWLMDSSICLKRLNNGGFPRFQDISESCLTPNVEVKYSLLNYGEGNQDESRLSKICLSEAQIEIVSLLPLCSADKILKDFIFNEINSFYYSEKYVSIFSPDSPPTDFECFGDLSVIGFNLYPSLTKFPIFIQDTFKVLALPYSSKFIGVISIAKYQPLPVLTRRLIELKNSSEGKEMAMQALILALHKEKFAMALELNPNWFALLVSIIIGSNIHLAMDILPPGYIITT
ncbi:uncharacterized protein ELE39_000311 [Cryptosporidium sp. chipmunk genotype I]|uniref:uncharacterized protein n=1 Tax=Cryptosporidium sp. chipmunk genotype I TaxID=1280935 RepID=UPI00351A3233|nr:hypothetical protein ELE39_000311 [Cryptosporidium sp. chipmunk genotype I]